MGLLARYVPSPVVVGWAASTGFSCMYVKGPWGGLGDKESKNPSKSPCLQVPSLLPRRLAAVAFVLRLSRRKNNVDRRSGCSIARIPYPNVAFWLFPKTHGQGPSTIRLQVTNITLP